MTACIRDLLSGFDVPENNRAIARSYHEFFSIRPKCDAGDVTFASFEDLLAPPRFYVPQYDMMILVPECEFFSIRTEGDIGPGSTLIFNDRFLPARHNIE
jgi:hypothetical protein